MRCRRALLSLWFVYISVIFLHLAESPSSVIIKVSPRLGPSDFSSRGSGSVPTCKCWSSGGSCSWPLLGFVIVMNGLPAWLVIAWQRILLTPFSLRLSSAPCFTSPPHLILTRSAYSLLYCQTHSLLSPACARVSLHSFRSGKSKHCPNLPGLEITLGPYLPQKFNR